MTGFEAELDMLGPIGAAAESFAGPGAVAVNEVPAAAGVPDVVVATFSDDVLATRIHAGFVTDPATLGALLVLSDGLADDTDLPDHRIAALIGVSKRYTRSRLLPFLSERGLASTTARGAWCATQPYVSLVQRVVTIEAKLRDWKRGLGQAVRHAAGADEAWLVMDEKCARAPTAGANWFRGTGVGLASISRTGGIRALVAPGKPETLRLRRELLAERTAELYCSGQRSGRPKKVFGRYLTPSSTESDPRYAGVAANSAQLTSCSPRR